MGVSRKLRNASYLKKLSKSKTPHSIDTVDQETTITTKKIVDLWNRHKSANPIVIKTKFFGERRAIYKHRFDFIKSLKAMGFCAIDGGAWKVVFGRDDIDWVVKIPYFLVDDIEKENESKLGSLFLSYLYEDKDREVLIQPRLDRFLSLDEFDNFLKVAPNDDDWDAHGKNVGFYQGKIVIVDT